MREAAKALARGLARWPPRRRWSRTPCAAAGGATGRSKDRAGARPGARPQGDYLRRAFLARPALRAVGLVQFGTLFSQIRRASGRPRYVGPRCHLAAHLERDVLLAAGVHVPSGATTHGTDDPAGRFASSPAPPGASASARTWVGEAAVVMADVGAHCVIGAGAVVTRPIPDYSVAAGVPARVIAAAAGSAGPNLNVSCKL